jgi:hypothetical protein
MRKKIGTIYIKKNSQAPSIHFKLINTIAMIKKTLAPLVSLFSLVFFFSHALLAQEKLSIDKVYSVYLRNSGPILEGEQIKGYYFFYQSDKIDKTTNEYTLQLLDANLSKIKDIKFQDSKNISLLESSYNGDGIGFLFYDNDINTMDFRLYGTDGKKKFNYTRLIDKRTEALINMYKAQKSEEGENQNVFDIKGKGFVCVFPVREGKQYSYEVDFYASEKKKKWTYVPTDEEKWASAQFLGASDSIAFVEVLKKEKLLKGKIQSFLLGINLHNGKKAFEVSTESGGNKILPMNISLLNNSKEFLLMGPYYGSEDRILQDKSDGLGVWSMNNKGKILKVDSKGRVDELGYVFFHDIIATEDGRIFAIGEGYKKAANAGGIALNVIGAALGGGVRGSGNTKIIVTDMLLLELSQDFKVAKAEIYEKNNNSMAIPGTDFSSPHTMALFAKAFGAFDYLFTQTGKNNASFYTGYTDYEKTKEYKGLTFHSISYNEGSVTTDKINLKTSASSIRILPAKPGFVLMVEYFKKDKKLDLRLEKIN